MLIYHSKAYRIKIYKTKKYRQKVDVMTSFMMSFHVLSFCKMAPSKEQSKEVVKLYYESKSPVTVIRTMKRKSETCTSVIRNFQHSLDVVIKQKGRHLEHIL